MRQHFQCLVRNRDANVKSVAKKKKSSKYTIRDTYIPLAYIHNHLYIYFAENVKEKKKI